MWGWGVVDFPIRFKFIAPIARVGRRLSFSRRYKVILIDVFDPKFNSEWKSGT